MDAAVTTSSAAVAASANSANVNSTSKSSSNSKSSEASFDEEMKSQGEQQEAQEAKETEKTVQNKEEKVSDKQSKENEKDNEEIISSDVYEGEIDFTDFKYHNESQSILSRNIQDLLNTKDLMGVIGNAVTIDYDSINMSESDANFFANLVQNTDMSMKGIMNQIEGELVQNSQNVQRNIQVSSILMDKLNESLKTNRPFRIDFDKDISVIIKVNRDGSLSANFIPGDKAVEQYLRNNIASLKQRFDEENLPYSELSYSNSKQNQQERRKKENDNE